MSFKIMRMAGAFALLSTAALAQAVAPAAVPGAMSGHQPDAFKHLSVAEQAALVAKPGPGGLTLSVISDHENWYSEALGRTTSGVVEVHDHWIDVMTVLSGDATLTIGGTVTGGQPTGPGETRGGQITGGTIVQVHPGDYIQIPAGTPHLTTLAPGTTFHAMVVKVRQ